MTVTQIDIHQSGLADNIVEKLGADFISMLARQQPTAGDKIRYSKYEEDDSSSSDSDSTEENVDESCSEGETVDSDDYLFGDDLSLSRGSDSGSASDTSESSSSNDSDTSDSILSDDSSEKDTDDEKEPSETTSNASNEDSNTSNIDEDASAEEEDYGYDINQYRWRRMLRNRMQSRPKAALEIRVAGAKSSFCILRNIRTPLYASPPIVHPSKPLVIWPVGGGEILFADYDNRTYFVRGIRTSTPAGMSLHSFHGLHH
jgi:hypothetical protein